MHVMLQRRQILVIILGLHVGIVIWQISVQQSAVLDTTQMQPGGGGQLNDLKNYHKMSLPLSLQQQQQLKQKHQQQQQQLLDEINLETYAGKHLLSERLQLAAASSNESATEHGSNATTVQKQKQTAALTPNNNSSDSNNRSSRRSSSISSTTTIGPPTILVTAATVQPRVTAASEAPSTSAAATVDFARLIDLQNFSYLMEQPRCAPHIEALILVHSAPFNREKRQLLRETWGSIIQPETPLRLIFLLGAVRIPSLQHALQQENAAHNDLVQGTFVDDYRNMTYKHVMAFKWFVYNCAHAQLLIKVDDDVFVNTPLLLKYLRQAEVNVSAATNANNTADMNTNASPTTTATAAQFNATATLFRHPQNLLFCERYPRANVKRSYRSKWRVSFKEYAGRHYPPYCPGYALIYSADVVFRLYSAAQEQPYFWIDDVYITGITAERCSISITPSKAYVLYAEEFAHLIAGKTDLNDVEYLYAWHLITPQEIRALWRLHLLADSSLPAPHAATTTTTTTITTITTAAMPQAVVQPSLHDDYANNLNPYATYEGFR